jgi:Ti-type conjugative transfer relaxase TraA
MAIYHFSAKVIQRSQGRSAIAAAAYRAAEALHDESLGRTFNYLDKPGVVHSEILLPEGAPTRWLDRSVLWNEAQQVERRKDAVLAREIELALPRELSQAEAIALAQDFVREQFVKRGMVADLNVHWGQSADGEAQPHAHIMLTMRRVVPGPEGHPEEKAFGLKERAWNDKAQLRNWRTRWSELVNERLAEAGIDARVDHRSNAARGIDLEPQNKIGPAGARRAVRGEDAERADEHRAIARRNGERLLAEPELALQALTRQQSTFTRQDLARLVHRHSDGAAQFAAVMAKVEASPELVRVGNDGRDQARHSTREMVAIERRMEAAALELSRCTTHPVAVDRRKVVLAGGTLGEEQRHAFAHVTRSRDLTVVVGYAGTGKSTMLGAARRAWEAEGYTVRGAALSGIAAEGLEGGSGITSRTIASWEHAWAQSKETLGPRDVLVMDEAGMVGSRQMERVLQAVRVSGAKLVLVGDYEQLQAIEAGAAFRAIVERVGAAEITEVRRQQVAWQREATRELATGRTGEALARYQAAGMVQAHATDEAALTALIASWQAARERAPGERQIILAHTRGDVRALNDAARAVRQEVGELGEDRVLPTELGPRSFAVGDHVYFLRNERGLGGVGVKNGTLGTIVAIDGDGEGAQLAVRLGVEKNAAGNAKVVSFALAEYADLDHGYAATTHKAQSVTVDRTHVLATPSMDRHLAYVALTRHRHKVALHWSEESFGSPARLVARLSRERAKDTTLDYGESAAELSAAYAERRGLVPLAAATEALVHDKAPQPGTARSKLLRFQFSRAVQPVLSALRHLAEEQKTVLAGIGKMLAEPGSPEPDWSTPEPAVSETYRGENLHILDGIVPPGRRRPRDHVVQIDPVTPEQPTKAPKLTSVAQPDRPKAATHRRAARKVPLIPTPHVPTSEPLPWAGLDPTPPASPLLRAARHEPISALQTQEAVDRAVGRERRHLEQRYGEAYRNPQEAEARFTLLKVELGIEAARDRVAHEPSVLGSLRGGWLTAGSRKDRAQALRSGRKIADDDQKLRKAEKEARYYQRAADEKRREQAAIEVPGLSPKAQAAVRVLADAEVRPNWTPPELSKDCNPTPERIVAMGKCARLYEAILADGDLLAELNRFERAVGSRLAYDGQVGSGRLRQVPDAAREAGRLLGVVVAARALHAWYPVLRDHVASHPALKLRVEQAEFMLRLNADRMRQTPGRGPDLKPSPGPSLGPGM